MNETLKEHIELKANGTMAGKRFLHLDEINPNYNYAANTYLIALDELAAMQARIEKLERIEKISRQISSNFSKTEIIYIYDKEYNVWSIIGDAEKDELEDALKGEE